MMDQDFVIKISVLALYVGVLFLIGILASRRIKGMSDYYVGGKNMGFWAVAFSARATGESGWLLIGLTGMGAMAGFSGYWVVVGELLGVLFPGNLWLSDLKRDQIATEQSLFLIIYKATSSLLTIHFEL